MFAPSVAHPRLTPAPRAEVRRPVNAEARDLAARGTDVIQLDEPWFNISLDKERPWGVEALGTSGPPECAQ